MRPELEIRVVKKDTFKEVIIDTMNTERRSAANSVLRRNGNTDYLKTEESINNINNKRQCSQDIEVETKLRRIQGAIGPVSIVASLVISRILCIGTYEEKEEE